MKIKIKIIFKIEESLDLEIDELAKDSSIPLLDLHFGYKV